MIRRLFTTFCLMASAAATAADPAAVTAARLGAADQEPGQWMSIGRTYDEQRFSPLAQINTENVSKLGLAWFADFDSNRKQEATPLVIDGVMYVSTAWSRVKAYDARSGKTLWTYDPKVPGEYASRGCCDIVNRGLAAWEGKIFVGSFDGRLIALDAKTGKSIWEVQTVDRDKPYTITGAPRVVKGRVLIGNGGAEYGVRGYVTAYDAASGKLAWRFYTVPGDPAKGFEAPILAKAAQTWNGKWWLVGGGGTVWDAMAYDPKLNLIYIGVGNGSPWNPRFRSPGGGDNLFLASIVALHADTGAYAWHYQTSPGEGWDYTATQHIMVADLKIEGRSRRVVMQAPKNGFFYVLDAKTGALISARNFVETRWASGIDLKTGRPIPIADARYDVTGKAAVIQPGPQGAHNWHPMSFNRATGLVYFSAVTNSMIMKSPGTFEYRPMATNLGIQYPAPPELLKEVETPGPSEAQARLIAWDPVKQREVWHTGPLGTQGSGTLATAGGLVFQGTADSHRFVAYRATDGKELWSVDAQSGVVAAAASYEIDGEQYIAVEAGYGLARYGMSNGSRLLVFKLGGAIQLPSPPPPPPAPVLDPPTSTASSELIEQGHQQFVAHCTMCHEPPSASRAVFPDLRYSPTLRSAEAFSAIVLGGALQANGMASFKGLLTEAQAQSIREYVIVRANQAKASGATSR